MSNTLVRLVEKFDNCSQKLYSSRCFCFFDGKRKKNLLNYKRQSSEASISVISSSKIPVPRDFFLCLLGHVVPT